MKKWIIPWAGALLLCPSWLWACTGNCGDQWAVLTPRGTIAGQEKTLILTALGLMLLVVVPVILMTFMFAWKYRASNPRADYDPDWDHSTLIEWVVWTIPTLIVAVLGYLVWTSSHTLSPYRPIASSQPPLEVQVVAMDWKWLFIYPEWHIATVNRLVIPAGVPVHFSLTSDAVMSSFFIPQLGGQIYAMAGMKTHLHLIADRPGVFQGYNTQFSGQGFSGMTFETVATSREAFRQWAHQVETGGQVLDRAAFASLEKPSINEAPHLYSLALPHLFDSILSGDTTLRTMTFHSPVPMTAIED
ncbi:ubiquinol oxidase subunit II [Ferrovum sp.]|uniref:ubiquinol oxidase subunit II n=1 Tax=Ferrovum sp. TaxID=2609467 RepID=UPI0026276ECB|nr:ubiquinol oxidase subunit II [Ferrovum sp.]